MKRRRIVQASSLDLFLDTICNAFGGIMFMAILLSVLVQNRSKQPATVSPSHVQMTASEAREVVSKFDSLSSTHSRLSELLIELRKSQPLPDNEEIRNLYRQCEQAQKELDDVLLQQSEVSKELGKQLERNAKIVQSKEDFRASLTAERSSLEKDTRALDEALAGQMEVLKLPVVKTSSKVRVYLFLQYNKIYALTTLPVEVSIHSELNEEHFNIRRIDDRAFNAAPKSSRGWSPTSKEVASYLKSCSSASHVFAVLVWPDSHAEFGLLKEKLIEQGFQYELQPIPDLPFIPFSPGSSDSRVQ